MGASDRKDVDGARLIAVYVLAADSRLAYEASVRYDALTGREICTKPSAMAYSVKEIFYTLQGEGAQAGRAAVFCRFSGCNLWSGRGEGRARALCQFCDTDFVGTGPEGGRFKSAEELADAVDRCWGGGSARINS